MFLKLSPVMAVLDSPSTPVDELSGILNSFPLSSTHVRLLALGSFRSHVSDNFAWLKGGEGFGPLSAANARCSVAR
jgi:hypothetical protein